VNCKWKFILNSEIYIEITSSVSSVVVAIDDKNALLLLFALMIKIIDITIKTLCKLSVKMAK